MLMTLCYYVSASPNTEDANKRIDVIGKCCVDINSWMACNYMKLNTDTTEVLCIGTPANLKKVPVVRVSIVSHEIVASHQYEGSYSSNISKCFVSLT